MNGVWKDEEVKSLFEEVRLCKSQGKALREAFAAHAKKHFRKPNSVRNYYYCEIERLKKDEKRRERLAIDLEEHKKVERNYFSPQEKSEIITKIKNMVSDGYSVRKACLMLSGGDVSTMLRYQNKFRSSQPPKSSNVLTFRGRPSKITESDLQGLFMGLVRLVRKNAEEELRAEALKQRQNEEEATRQLIAKLGQKERELSFLREDIARLKNENLHLKKQVMQKICLKAAAKNAKA